MFNSLLSAASHSVRILLMLVFATSVSCAQQSEPSQESKSENESQQEEFDIPFDWYELEEAQQLAAKNDKKVLVYAEAAWCPYCKRMKSEVFPKKEVEKATEKYFYPVFVDIESEEKLTFRGEEVTQAEFSRAMRVSGTPTFIFIDSEGEIIAAQPGFIPADIYTQMLNFVGADAYLEQSFEEFSGIGQEQE